MNPISHRVLWHRLLRAGVVAALLGGTALARSGFETLVESAREAMKAGDWQAALTFHERTLAGFGQGDPLAEYGPQFGTVYYRKGLCEMKLGRWADAMRSFEACYLRFPNTAAAGGNVHQRMALLKWGECAMAAGDWKLAASRFAKFDEVRDKDADHFARGAFHINRAICHFKLGQLTAGVESLEIALRNKRDFPTPDTGIMAGFQALAEAATAARDERLLLDFIGKNRGELVIEPFRMCRFSGVFLKLAGDALAAGMTGAAMELYRFIPATDVAIDDLKARLRSLGGAETCPDGGSTLVRATLAGDLAALEEARRQGHPPETVVLAATAAIHEAAGNLPGAWAAWRQLEDFHPKAPARQANLWNLIRLAAATGQPLAADARRHLAVFPESEHAPAIRRLALLELLAAGRYAECVEMAVPETDDGLYALGAARFHLGETAAALAALDRHAADFPGSEFAGQVAFLRAAAADEPAGWDAFLAAHPDSPLAADALCRAAAAYLRAGDPDAAAARLDRLDREIPPTALRLRGELAAARGDKPAAETAWRAALKQAEPAEIPGILCALVELLAPAPAAVPLADAFWKSHAAAPEAPRMALAQAPAWVAAGRGSAALARLAAALEKPGDFPKQALADAWVAVFLKTEGPAGLTTAAAGGPAPRELLVAAARALEGQKDAAGAWAALKRIARPDELEPAVLIQLGDHLRLQTATPREALPWYEEVLRRPPPAGHGRARLGRADVLARSAAAADVAAAREDYRAVFAESADAGEREYALFRLAGLEAGLGNAAEAARLARIYLEAREPRFEAFAAPMRKLLESP